MTLRGTIAILAALAAPASAHVVVGTPSLHALVRDADLVARVRIAAARRMLEVDGGRRAVVDATVLETLHGEPLPRVTFAPHGHGAAEYHDGEEALVFLRRIGRVPELATTPLAARVAWASVQETTDEIPLDRRTRHAWLDATRRYLRARADPVALRDATIALLASPDPRLAGSALRALVEGGEAFAIDGGARDRLVAVADRPSTPITVRVALLAELERRGLADAPARWARLLDTTRGDDRRRVVRAAAAHPSAPVTAALARIAGGPDALLAADAAVALGAPGNDAGVDPLVRLLAAGDPRRRFAAVRGLGGIGTARAVEALRHAAAFHTDAATRRRAGAEVAVRSARAPRG